MRWKHVVVGLALTVAGVAGCKQQCFLNECDYDHYRDLAPMTRLNCDPSASVQPTLVAMPTPSTVFDPDRDLYFLTLGEAIAQALEHGTVGSQSAVNPGFANDNLVSFNINSVQGSDAIRVLALDPAIIGANIDASLAKFDVQWTTSATWNVTDQPMQGLNSFQNGTTALVSSSLLKPLPTGGVAGITFSTNYQDLTIPPRGFNILNPAYTPRLQFQFEQPLLQGFGVEINQLRISHPGSILTPFPTSGRVEGVVITRIRFDQQRTEFERNVNFMLLNVETAYWNLYDAYWTLYSREAALRQAYEAWKINKARYEAGRIAIQDFAQTRQQYELFRGQRLTALGQILENERQLRGLLGLPREDGKRLIPVDAPTLTPYEPDWNTAVNETLALRPELVLAREDLKFRQLDIINAKNLLLPDLRFTSTYDLNGLGSRLDGTENNAFRSLASDKFNDWSVGLRMTVPLGFRDAHSQVRVARLNLARSYQALHDQELKAEGYLALQYRHLFEFHEQIQIQRAQREAAAVQLDARFKEFLAGRGTLDILLEAQRVWADALRTEYDAIAQYNNALVAFEFAKGTLLQRDNVVISEGALPQCAQKRAVEHEREKAVALKLRERENPVLSQCGYDKDYTGVPAVPSNVAPSVTEMSVPSLLEPRQAVTEPAFQLPPPKPVGPTQGKVDGPAMPVPSGNLGGGSLPTQMQNSSPTLPSLSSGALGTRPDAPRMLPLDLPAADKALQSLPK
jgi:outer membrane protein TolC